MEEFLFSNKLMANNNREPLYSRMDAEKKSAHKRYMEKQWFFHLGSTSGKHNHNVLPRVQHQMQLQYQSIKVGLHPEIRRKLIEGTSAATGGEGFLINDLLEVGEKSLKSSLQGRHISDY